MASASFTHQFLEEATKAALVERGLPVSRCEIISERLAGGYICTTLRVKAHYTVEDPKLFPSFIIKLEEEECADHEIASELHLYEREWLFYDKLSGLVRAAGVVAPIYFGPILREDGHSVGVVLEDLCIEGHPAQPRKVEKAILCPTLDTDGVVLTVKGVAKMHAHFYGKRTTLESLGVQAVTGEWFRPSWPDKVKKSWPAFDAKWKATIPADHRSAFETIVEKYADVQGKLGEEPTTLLHGDVKPANMFLLKVAAGDGKTEDVPAFIDWQYIGIGRGVCDLAFFLIEGFTPEETASLEPIALAAYYDGLKEHGFTFPGGLDALKKDWAMAVAYFPVYVCMWFGTVKDEDLVDKDFPARIVNRTGAALVRHGSTALLQ